MNRRNWLTMAFILLFALLGTSISIFAQGPEDDVRLGEPLEMPEKVTSQPVPPTAPIRRGGLTVNPQNRQESLDFYQTYYLPSEGVEIGWTGNHGSCNAGTTSQAFRDAVALRINYFRAMAGVPADITLNDTYNSKAQEAALMMSANGDLDHFPPEDWNCYTEEGAEGAGSSNLFLGVNGASAITGYIQDPGANNERVGHRRWILYPQTEQMGSGDIPSVNGYRKTNALWVFDHLGAPRPETREEYVAWPPLGYVPYQVVFARWSFSYDDADFSEATVSMTSGGSSVSVEQHEVSNGPGEETLVWIPMGLNHSDAWPQPTQDTTYMVEVSNVLIDGTARTFEYSVTVFDPTAPIPTPDPNSTPTATRTSTPTASPMNTPTASPTSTAGGDELAMVGQIGGGMQTVFVEGDYAYIGVGPRLTILDISTPTAPTMVGQMEELFSSTRVGIYVADGYAYIADRYNGLRVIDVSDPTSPSEVGSLDTRYAYSVAVANGYAYIADWNSLQVVDISDPTNPTPVGFSGLDDARDVAVAGNYAYVADYDYGLRIIDISDPTSPQNVGALNTPESAYAVAVAGNYAYLTDYSYGLRLFDISNRTSPQEVGSFEIPSTYVYAYDVSVANGTAYIANLYNGLWVVDVSTPTNPQEIASFNTSGSAYGVVLDSGIAYVADNNTLEVVDISTPATPQSVGAFSGGGSVNDVAIDGQIALLAVGANGLQVVDISDAAHPQQLATLDTPGSANAVTVANGHAYIADGSGGLQVVDISTPAAPVIVGSESSGYASNLVVAGNYAYLVGYNGLQVVDISDPTTPSQVATLDTPGYANDIVVAEGYAYITNQEDLLVIDISDPSNPTQVASLDTPELAWGVAVAGDYAYVTDLYPAGLRVIDISNPTSPSEVGAINTAGRTRGVAVLGSRVYLSGW